MKDDNQTTHQPLKWLESATATWQDVGNFINEQPHAILPLGATEQHGPHLPLNTDTLLADELAKRIADQSGGLVLPALPIGYSWVWRDHPGTLTFSFNTFRAVIKDIAHSLDREGVKALLILSGHAANVGPLKYTVRELADEIELSILHCCYPGLSDIIENDAQSEQWMPSAFHAEEFETSMMLALRPDLVQMDKAVREYPPHSIQYSNSSLPMGNLSQSGVFGDATVADAERGEAWLKGSAQKITELWEQFLKEHEVS